MNENEREQSLIAFTDGSSLGNPGPGGWGAVIVYPKLDELVELGGMKAKTTNNAMELEAIIATLAYSIYNQDPLHIFTDSQYVINGVQHWMYQWERNNWRTKQGNEVKNLSLWKNLYQLVQEKGKERIHWHHVSGHVGIPGNERADDIAQSFAQGREVQLYRGRLSEYPIHDILEIVEEEALIEKKTTKNARAYSYLSLVDGEIQRHKTWTQCEARVRGKKAKFRKAISEEHEREIIESWKKDGL